MCFIWVSEFVVISFCLVDGDAYNYVDMDSVGNKSAPFINATKPAALQILKLIEILKNYCTVSLYFSCVQIIRSYQHQKLLCIRNFVWPRHEFQRAIIGMHTDIKTTKRAPKFSATE